MKNIERILLGYTESALTEAAFSGVFPYEPDSSFESNKFGVDRSQLFESEFLCNKTELGKAERDERSLEKQTAVLTVP